MRKSTISLLAGAAAIVAGAGLLSVPASAEPSASAGWGGADGNIPPGLLVSGANGRVDNGIGNGGENVEGRTPNRNGEDGGGDDDPGHSDGHSNSDKNDDKAHSPASRGIDGVD